MMKKRSRSVFLVAAAGCLWAVLLVSNANVSAQGTGGYAAPYLQADFIQNLADFPSPLVNPALTTGINQMHLDLGLYRYAVGDGGMGWQQGTFLMPFRRNHTFGLSAIFQSQDITTDLSQQASYQDIWIMPSYAFRIFPSLSVGGNLKIHEWKEFDAPTTWGSPGIDIGVYYNPIDDYRFGNFGFSLCLQDLLPTGLFGDHAQSSNFISPNRARAGIRWAGLNDNLVVDAEVVVDNAMYSVFKNVSAYAKMFQDSFGNGNITAGYRFGGEVKYLFNPALWVKAGWTNNNIPFLGFNYNLMWLFPEYINHANADVNLGYSFTDLVTGVQSDRGFTIMGKLGLDFGRTREQVLSKQMYDLLVVAPMEAYSEAMRLYAAGRYWDASFKFGEVLALFPAFQFNDRVKYYMGDCFTRLQMYAVSRQVLNEALEEYTTSDQRPKYIYGLMQLDYYEGKLDDALKNYSFITSLYPEDGVRPDADYLAGEIQFQKNNLQLAEQFLGRLKPGDASYYYAQYTLAVINIENGRLQPAIGNLAAITKDSSLSGADRMLADAASLKLGHLYFENADKLKDGLKDAVRAYQRVEESSPYRDEAVLGIAWSLIKSNHSAEAKDAINYIITNLPESPLVPEAYLIKGYSLMLDKKYADAIAALQQSIATSKKPYVGPGDLEKCQANYKATVDKFVPMEERIKKNAMRKPTNKSMEEQSAMDRDFQQFSKETREYFTCVLTARSHARFFKRKDEVLADAEYALAKANSMVKSQNIRDQIDKQNDEKRKIEEQKRKIQEELEKLNSKQSLKK